MQQWTCENAHRPILKDFCPNKGALLCGGAFCFIGSGREKDGSRLEKLRYVMTKGGGENIVPVSRMEKALKALYENRTHYKEEIV